MSAHVKLGFVKLHRWRNPYYFNVYHGDEGTGWPDTRVNGPPIGLWRYGWEKAGFGHGYFGVGSFGWAQGSKVGGGFGHGRFGLGEFGYYNEPTEWISPRKYEDGVHWFSIVLVGRNGTTSFNACESRVLLRSIPPGPAALFLESMTGATAVIRWIAGRE